MRVLLFLVLAACSAPAQPATPTVDAAPIPPDTAPSPDAPAVVDDPCFPSPHAGHVVYSCSGIAFDVEVPAACIGGGCGVILDVHGMTMSAAMEDANTEMRARAGAAGFIVIQPSANPAPPRASWSPSDDPLLFDFLTRAIAVYRIDSHRVHMTGFSQGGFMTWRFLCAHADVLASVAPGAGASNCGTQACSFTGSEMPSQQIPILYMHGRADQNYVSYSCAQPQIDAVVAAWGLGAGTVVASDSTYTRTRWTGSGPGLLEHLAHDYTSTAQVPYVANTELLGHCYPGSADPGNQPGQLFSFKCDQAASFTWGSAVVDFFVAHPR